MPRPPLRGGVADSNCEESCGCTDVSVARLRVWRQFRHCDATYDDYPCSNSGTDHNCCADNNGRRDDYCDTDHHYSTDHHRHTNDDSDTDHHRRTNDDSDTDHHRRTHHQRWHNNYDWAYPIGMARRHWGESLWASQRW